ncbi:MAG: RNA polymerase sigma factor [Planctomycetes bacterium]|nr:RNA polymerase sigma factor [Planctomycetota bacterium]MBL7143037.1 RNA polymerase sigma factor [Phycisphaerae bacterium]
MPEGHDTSTSSDEQIIRATLGGDISSFGIIVERYWDMSAAFALSKIKNTSDAEDVAQESFIKAYSQLHRLRNPSRFAGWLSKIVSQQCVNHIRKNSHQRTASSYASYEADVSAQAVICSSNPGLTNEQVHFVRKTISKLPEKFRKVIIMRFAAGLSAAQIAEKLGKRHGTVRVWLHRAYQILRKDLVSLLEEVE